MNPKLIFILPLVGCSLLIAAGIWYGFNTQAVQNNHKTSGTVVQILEQGRGYTPEIAYTVDGKEYKFSPLSSQSPSPYELGDTVELYYDPTHPEEAQLDSFLSLWFGPLMLAIAGGMDLLLGLILYQVHERRQNTL